MKYLVWLKQNINIVSFLLGAGLIAAGRIEEGRLIIGNMQ